MMRLTAPWALILFLPRFALPHPYQLIEEYNASNFFEEFRFFNVRGSVSSLIIVDAQVDSFQNSDPTGGFVRYVDFDTAASTGLISNGSKIVRIGVDKKNTYTAGGPGRPSVRLESKMSYTEGLFVLGLAHLPTGCGVWPGKPISFPFSCIGS